MSAVGYLLGACGVSAAAPVVRVNNTPPAPPLPCCHPYDSTLPFTPPDKPDVRFYRGAFSSVRVPGIVLRPGMAGYTLPPGQRGDLAMSEDIFLYADDPATQTDMLYQHAVVRGLTHFQLSIPHAIQAGYTIQAFVALARRVRDEFGMFPDIWFLQGGEPWGPWDETRDRDWSYWQPKVQPWVDALKAEDLVPSYCVGWQLDQYNTGTDQRIQSIIRGFHAALPDSIGGCHWAGSESGAWNDPYNRGEWYESLAGTYVWFHQQGTDPAAWLDQHPGTNISDWIADYQSHLVDTLNFAPFYENGFGLVVFEPNAQNQFNAPTVWLEPDGDTQSYLLCCTKAASHVAGYGNGWPGRNT